MRNGVWHQAPGALAMRLVTTKLEDSDEQINALFTPLLSSASKGNRRDLVTKLNDCRHKLYAVRYHMTAIKNEIELRVEEFENNYSAGAGAQIEVQNPVLIYETEGFLFQVKSNIDLLVQVVGHLVPSVKSFRTFRHAGEAGNYVSGGKVIRKLSESDEDDLATAFEGHRQRWIQDMTIMRDTITHHSSLRDFHCFVEEPYRGGDAVNIHYPTMPSGERVDVYCERIYDALRQLYQEVFQRLEQRVVRSSD